MDILVELRPALHRYCARMTGSVIDGEDVVQETFAKALAHTGDVANPRGWLFRVAHNTALDLLRRRGREVELLDDEDPRSVADQALAKRAALRMFMYLPVAQRQVVILMDVLGYSLDDIATLTDRTVPAIKAALHRGRETLHTLVAAEKMPALDAPHDVRLLAYIDRFNARDFDAVRDMLAEDVHLDLVSRLELRGKTDVRTYFSNYASKSDWHFVPGRIEGRSAALATDNGRVVYFVLLEWNAQGLRSIRDFRYARYVLQDASEHEPTERIAPTFERFTQ